MGFYRKKPVEIEARQLEYNIVSQEALAEWCGGIIEEHKSGINIPTLEGVTYAQVGDFIIKGVKGEFYACKPDIFELTYQLSATEMGFKGIILDQIAKEFNSRVIVTTEKYDGKNGYGYLNREISEIPAFLHIIQAPEIPDGHTSADVLKRIEKL